MVGAPVTAADPENDELFYSISGADAAFFSVDASSGQLETNRNVDFDFETRNAYELTLSVHDHRDAAGEPSTEIDDSVAVAISVTNVDEPGSLELRPTSAPRVGSVITAVLTDPDGVLLLPGTHHARWYRSRSPNGSSWSAITYFGPSRIGGGLGDLPAGSMYTPVANDVGMYLRVIVTYRDGHGAGKLAEIVISSAVQAREAAPALTVQDFVTGLTLPRDIGFTPDGAMLFTEHRGILSVRLADGTVRPVTADLSDLQAATRGVLMSLAIDPDFATNRRFYTYQGDLPLNMQVVVWEMNADYTTATRVIDPLLEGFSGGARLRFGPDGYLWMSVHYSDNHAAPQDLGLLGGKVLRFDKATGVGAADNPFPTAPLVYTYGHRNPQGLALRPGTTQMWSVEHGPLWDDEVNLLTPGANHGWNPNSEGPPGQAQYASMTDLDAFPDAVVARWTSGFSTIAPSGATFLEGDDWGEWEGRLAVATLKTLSLRLFEFSAAGEFVSQVVATNVERLHYRLRTPVLGPDGALYITTSDATNDPGTDRILRVVPSLPPAFAAPSADHTVAENINPSTVVATFAATDPEGGEVRYTLGGTDAGSFNLADERLGELRANQAFDFETRRTYEVVVDAHDPYGLTDSLTLTVSVTNLDETGGVTFDKQRPIRNQPLTATLVDPDGVQGAEIWTWHRSTSRGGGWGEPITGAGSNVFTPVAADREHYLRATVEYSDAHGAKTVQAITGLAASNMAPVLPDSVVPVSIPENTPAGSNVGGPVAASDAERDPLSYSLQGSSDFVIDSRTGQIKAADGVVLDFDSGQTSYTLTVGVDDGFEGRDSVTVTITLTDVNEPPVAVADPAVTTEEDTPVTFDVLGNDTDPDEGDTLTVMTITTQPRRGRVVVDTNTQMLTYTPAKDDHDTYTFMYTARDDDPVRMLTSPAARVTVTVNPVNDAPEFETDVTTRTVSESAQPGDEVGTKVEATDVDDITLTYSLSGASDFVIDATGQIRVAPDITLDREHTPSYEVTVTADDGKGGTDSITVTINVSNVNEAPTAVNDTATTAEDQSVRIDVLANDTDPDTERAALRVSVGRQPLNGTASVERDRTITYTPNANFAGENSFTYSVSDGSLSDAGSVTVTVEAVNDAPTFPSPTAARSVPEDAEADDNVGTPVTARDIDSATLIYRLTGASEFEIVEDTGQIQVAPGVTLDRERTPSYEVTVTASDGKGGTDSITVTINVSNVNEAPTAVNDTATTDEDTRVNIDVLANDTDPDTERAALTVSVLRDPLDGTARVESDRTITYTPNANFAGENSFTYRLSDGSLSDDGSVTVTVEAVNDAPAFPAATAERSVPEDAEADDNVGTPVTARDIDSATLIYRLTGASEFEIVEDTGQIQVAPGVTLDRERTPSYEVTVTASDGKGGTDSITVTINVSNVNEAPTAVNDTATTDEDQSVRIDVLANDTDPDTERAALTVSVLRDPLDGTARVESDRTITYTPNANFAGENSFTYRLSDGSLSDDGSVTVTVEAVNDAPAFPAATAERTVSEQAKAGDPVGAALTATDVDGDTLTYGLTGAAASDFEIDEQTGQITVAEGAALNVALSPYTVTVTARDPDLDEATVEVTITVTARPVIIITGGGGGGGGGGGPTPSEVDFEWTVDRDIEELDGANDRATGVWSDGTTLWVADNADGAGDAVYAYDLASGERVEEREFDLAEANRAPRGIWSDRSVVWVSDSGRERLFAYDLATGERLEEREFALAAGNSDARGIWSDEETMWVLDSRADALFAYALASGELLAEYALDSANDDPHGIWSDGVTVWVSNHDPKRLFAYRLPVLPDAETDSGEEDADDDARELERVRDEEFTELSKASNNSPRGIWSDGDVMYVADESDDRVYSYNMPDAIDARLASLTLSGVDIGEFDPGRTDYEGPVADGVTETTVEAEAMQRRTDVAIDPPDADGDDANGHQVALQDLGEITVTVTSADGSRKKVYRVQFPETGWDPARDPWPHCLRGALSEGFSLVVYEGGSVEELVSCAESRGIVAFYALHDGAYVSYILGAPDFVNAGFLELFPDGLPPVTPLVAGSNGPPSADPFGDDLEDGGQPWPECLRDDIAAGFSLVVYEGGSVDELEACARSRDVSAVYALVEGEYVSYILGARAFVTQPFRDLFADGLPLMTPLVARSQGQPR